MTINKLKLKYSFEFKNKVILLTVSIQNYLKINT